ncbi:YIP1 family protein [Sphingopyxis lindanitolerans]|uniref:YIP1 family protein n=1 Tax=Sphingopyxis lindanitolerans TaxID=2054227 RepID=A0A2S8B435_9SPHN|nr:Yip1 family protein [Sphingopyxis lindanitolerans]PQM27088.1 YIP1 family protein [Sphingopyxis lindanitolerans]
MTDAPSNPLPPVASGILQRAKDILLKPKETWPVIAAEPATTQSIYMPYVLLLAAIGPLAGFIGGQVFGITILGVTYHPPLAGALVSAVLSYGLTLASVFLLALVIDGLAPSFGGQKDQVQALKVAAYAGTAGWVGGIFGLIPALALIGMLFALYGLYILFLGLPILMKAPQDKALGYTVVVIIVAILLFLVIGAVVAAVAAPSFVTIR